MDAQEKFDRSIAFYLKWEGGRNFSIVDGKPVIKSNAKADLGGATAYGVTLATLKTAFKNGIVSHDDICRLTVNEAKLIYRKNYWDKYSWEQLTWPVCLCCLDCCINHGGFASILQRAVIDCGQSVVVDGKFGPKTFAALKVCEPTRLARAIYEQRKVYYEKIVARNSTQKVHLKGWLRRADDMAQAAGVKP
ncbi:MAG: hypothetical protein IJ697_06905 [Synergistaceae bacterium]|nr:hypothetical protein [Synergistaceae bacterium]